MKQLSSLITTQLEASHQQIGRQAGELGLETQSNISRRLSKLAPQEVLASLVLRASQQSVEIHLEKRSIIKNGVYAGEYLQSVKIVGNNDNIASVLADFQKAEIPAEDHMIEGWLAELSVITAKRTDDDFTEGLRLSAYTSRLKHYPADIVAHGLLRHTWKFFPTWADLKDVLDDLHRPRRAILNKLISSANNLEA